MFCCAPAGAITLGEEGEGRGTLFFPLLLGILTNLDPRPDVEQVPS